MTSKERVRLAFLKKEADRVPVGELAIHAPISDQVLGRETLTGEGGKVKWTQANMIREGRRDEFVDRFKRDTAELHEALDLDLITVAMDPPGNTSIVYRDITEDTWVVVDEALGTWTRFKYERELDIVYEQDSSFAQGGVEAVEKYVEKLEAAEVCFDDGAFETVDHLIKTQGEKRFIIAKVPNLFPVGTSWFNLFMEMLYLEEELIQRLLDQYLRQAKAVAQRYCSMGADCVLNGGDWAYNAGPFFSPALIERFLVPQVNALADICHEHNIFLLKHTDGNVMPIEEMFFNRMGIDGFQAVEPHANMSLSLLKERYGDHITLMGNVDCATVLQFGTREEIEADTRRAIREGAAGGGLILSSSNSIHSAIPYQNYMYMLEAARKYGSYQA
jgi:hypothetical protein